MRNHSTRALHGFHHKEEPIEDINRRSVHAETYVYREGKLTRVKDWWWKHPSLLQTLSIGRFGTVHYKLRWSTNQSNPPNSEICYCNGRLRIQKTAWTAKYIFLNSDACVTIVFGAKQQKYRAWFVLLPFALWSWPCIQSSGGSNNTSQNSEVTIRALNYFTIICSWLLALIYHALNVLTTLIFPDSHL